MRRKLTVNDPRLDLQLGPVPEKLCSLDNGQRDLEKRAEQKAKKLVDGVVGRGKR